VLTPKPERLIGKRSLEGKPPTRAGARKLVLVVGNLAIGMFHELFLIRPDLEVQMCLHKIIFSINKR